MTSLAQQLKRLAVPHTQVVLGEDKRRVSLLFEPKEAATLDKETFYAIGLNGLQELGNIDGSFFKYESSLFGEASQDFERSLQTKETNEKLNEALREFLIKLSPYFLLRPAHKALEWLIYRYHIHLDNVDDILAAILPYYATNIFVRVVQTFRLDNRSGRWHWLQPIQKPGVPLSRLAVLNHCYKDQSFLTFICDLIPDHISVHGISHKSSMARRTVTGFFASTIIGALQCGPVTESLLSTLLPYMSIGLKSECDDYKASVYMILGQIASLANMKASLFDTVLPIITRYPSSRLVREMLCCLLVICQYQKLIALPKRTVKHLCRLPGLVPHIEHLTANFMTAPLLRPLLARLVPRALQDTHAQSSASDHGDADGALNYGPPQYASLLEALLTEVKLDDQTIQTVTSLIFQEFLVLSKKARGSNQESGLDRMRQFISIIEKRYPSCFDAIIERNMAEETWARDREAMQEFVQVAMSAAKHSLVAESGLSLMLGLRHPNPVFRRLSVEQLAKTLPRDDDSEEDRDFVAESILSRLDDEDISVVHAVLEIKKLVQYVPAAALATKLLARLEEHRKEKKWHSVTYLCIVHLTTEGVVDRGDVWWSLYCRLLPYLYTASTNRRTKEILHAILSSKFTFYDPVLKSISKGIGVRRKSWRPDDVSALITSFCESLVKQPLEYRSDLVQNLLPLCEGPDRLIYAPITMHILIALVHHDVSDDVTRLLYSRLLIKVAVGLLPLVTIPEGYQYDQKEALKTKLDVPLDSFSVMTRAVAAVISRMKCPDALADRKWWLYKSDDTAEDPYVAAATDLLDQLSCRCNDMSRGADLCRQFLQAFVQHVSTSVSVLCKLLSLVWSGHAATVDPQQWAPSPAFILRCLYMGQACFSEAPDGQIEHLLSGKSNAIPSILIALTNPYAPIRRAACLCLEELMKRSQQTFTYHTLVKRLLKVREELIADGDYLVQALSVIFRKAYRVQPSGTESPSKRKHQEDHQQLRLALDQLTDAIVYDASPIYAKDNLLTSLSLVNHKEVFMKVMHLLSALLKKLTTQGLDLFETRCVHLLIQRFTENTTDVLQDSDAVQSCFYSCLSAGTGHHGDYMSLQKLTLKQVTKEFYSALPTEELRQELLCRLLDLWVDTEEAGLAKAFSKTIRGLPLEAAHVEVELKKILPQDTGESLKETKRVRRNSRSKEPMREAGGIFETRPWKRTLLLLEALQTKKKMSDLPQLTATLFALLKHCVQQEGQASADYFKQLVMSCLSLVCHKLSDDVTMRDRIATEHTFGVEWIVQCIRTSDSSQTHQHALMLLTQAAHLFPDHVLHSVMSIFTFMGANIMRQDDSYSYQVLTNTVETVIPALIKAHEVDPVGPGGEPQTSLSLKPGTVDHVVGRILQVFVDAYPHIPQHRRLPLFNKLMVTVNADKFLWLLLVLLSSGHVVRRDRTKADDNKEDVGQNAEEFCLIVCAAFPPKVQILTAQKLLKYIIVELKDVERPKINVPMRMTRGRKSLAAAAEAEVLVDYSKHTVKQMKQLKYGLATLVNQLLGSDDFTRKVKELKAGSAAKMVLLYEGMLEECLLYISDVGRSMAQTGAGGDHPHGQYWNATLTRAYDILDKVNALLPASVFVKVVTGLVRNDLALIRRKSMELLSSRLSNQKQQKYQPDEVKSFLSLVPVLAAPLRMRASSDTPPEPAPNRQAALMSLRLLTRCFGQQHPGTFQMLLPLATKLMYNTKVNSQEVSSALLLLAELVSCLRAHSIAALPAFMPPLIEILDTKTHATTDQSMMNAVTAVQKIVEVLPNFLSPYLFDLLAKLLRLSCRYTDADAQQKTHVAHRLLAVRKHVATHVAARVLIPALTKCYNTLDHNSWPCVAPLMSTLSQHISELGRDDVTSYHQTMLTLFLTALDFRSQHPGLSYESCTSVEDHVIGAIVALVMKLSEATFRPVFYKLYDWATRSDVTRDRLLTFYRLCDSFASKMKSLFTLFAGHVVKNVAELFDACNTNKNEDEFFTGNNATQRISVLLSAMCDVMYKCFLYDNEGFLTKERFDTLMPALVAQLENLQGGEEEYERRLVAHLVPCIGQLAVAAGDDGAWKPLNYQICLQTRHAHPKVRFAALKVIEELHKKLGSDYMTLLPETIQFLVELTEDESFEVEQLCQDVISQLEKTLGEPLQKYF